MQLVINEAQRQLIVRALAVFAGEMYVLHNATNSRTLKEEFQKDSDRIAALAREIRELQEQDPNGDQRILALLRSQRLIEAIKLRRELTREGLKEAKDNVEALAVKHGIRREVPGTYYEWVP